MTDSFHSANAETKSVQVPLAQAVLDLNAAWNNKDHESVIAGHLDLCRRLALLTGLQPNTSPERVHLEALLDIWDDGKKPYEERSYIGGALAQEFDDVREFLAAQPATPVTGPVVGLLMQLAEDYADEAVNHGLYAPATYKARSRILGALLAALALPQEGEELVMDATDYPTLFDRTNNPTDVNTLLVPFRDMERALAAIAKANGAAS